MLNGGQFDPRSQDFLAQDRHDPNSYSPNPHFRNVDRGQGRLLAEQPYPRGYGPTRNRAVEESHPVAQYDPRLGKRDNSRKRMLGDAIKQSTIPDAHLKMAKNDWVLDEVSGGGWYDHSTRQKSVGSLEFLPSGRHSLTATHELGHDVAHQIMGRNAVDYHRSGVGVVEGFADAYMQHHAPLGEDRSAKGYGTADLIHTARSIGRNQSEVVNDAADYVHAMNQLGAKPSPSWDTVQQQYENVTAAKRLEHGQQLQLDLE